jgi:hypothetical protein
VLLDEKRFTGRLRVRGDDGGRIAPVADVVDGDER